MGRKPKWATIAPEELKEIEKDKVEVKCAFCNGTGKDPFQLLSKLSDCQVCSGKGKVKINGPTVKCNFCGGTGVQPYTTSRLHCLACGGVGVVTKIEPSKKCPKCDGTGIYPRRPHPVACYICKGQGVVAK
ncbi:hypothetical protein KKH65_04200 [bacterium]|nr:hypothetical protein [bacterium]